ncbi:MAG: hypothetical protein LWW83_01505 [Azonexaceae bacterium]|nr:hypothetical protein [Azonexaceae bacterium]
MNSPCAGSDAVGTLYVEHGRWLKHWLRRRLGDSLVFSQFAVGLNINNLFDKTCWSGLSSTQGMNFYGEPRRATLTLSAKF